MTPVSATCGAGIRPSPRSPEPRFGLLTARVDAGPAPRSGLRRWAVPGGGHRALGGAGHRPAPGGTEPDQPAGPPTDPGAVPLPGRTLVELRDPRPDHGHA